MDFTQEKCPICYEPFNYNKKPYLLLLCGHTFCSPCISRIKKECLEDDSKYKSLSDFYHEQKKNSNLCDSQTSVFSDNCKKKTDSEDEDEKCEENIDQQNLSRQSDSYIELDENEEKEELEDNKKETTGGIYNNNNTPIHSERESYIEEEEEQEEDEEEENENMSKSDEEDEEKEESDDNSEKSINDINDIIPINDADKKEEKKNNKKKTFKFRCPFCMFRIKITDKELIINENLLKINEYFGKNDDEISSIINTTIEEVEKKYFCEACNNIVSNINHFEKYGNAHDIYLFELNDNTYKRAFDNLKEFFLSEKNIISQTKNFLLKFTEKILNDSDLIKDCKNHLEKSYKYNSKFMHVLKKSKKKIKKFEGAIQKKNANNNNNINYKVKLKEEKELLESTKSFNQLIGGIFFYPEIKMKLIPINEDLTKISNIYLSFAIKESYNNSLQNGFFHFFRNKLYKTEYKYMPFYSSLTRRNFLFNSELNTSIVLKISKLYSRCCYEASSDGSTIYFLYSKSGTTSKFFSQNIHTKKKKNLPPIPINNFKKLDTIFYDNKKLFVIGGVDKFDVAITECCYFSIKNNKWEKMPNLKYARNNKALFISGKELYTFGGKCPPKDSSYIFEKIDLNVLKNWESFTINNFNCNIYNFGFCMYNQDILFVLGGEDQTTEDYIKKGYVLSLKDKKVIEEFNINDVHENNVNTPKFYRGIIISTDKELINVDFFNIWKRLHKLNINLP